MINLTLRPSHSLSMGRGAPVPQLVPLLGSEASVGAGAGCSPRLCASLHLDVWTHVCPCVEWAHGYALASE